MKKILALTLCCVMFVASSISVFANEGTNLQDGSPSIGEVMKELEEVKAQNAQLSRQIAALAEAVKASNLKLNSLNSGGGSGSGNNTPSTPPSSSNNVVNYGGTVTYQGGKVEINGGKSNVTFNISAPSSAVSQSAASLAKQLSGSLLSCISTSSPGVGFRTAKVNFFVSGVTNGDNIAVYQNQNGTWVQLPVSEIRQDHVVVNITRHGDIAFVRVPVLASLTN